MKVLGKEEFMEVLKKLLMESGSDYENIYYLENAVEDIRSALRSVEEYDIVNEPFFDGSTREGWLVYGLRKYGKSYELIIDYSYRRGAGMIVWSIEVKEVA